MMGTFCPRCRSRSTMRGTAWAASSLFTVTRTSSLPASASAATCATVPSTSAVSVLVMDCTTIGWQLPTGTGPIHVVTVSRRLGNGMRGNLLPAYLPVMRILGPIIRLQIQRSPMKTGEKKQKIYDPAPLLAVERLSMGPEGAIYRDNGTEIVDVHHRSHPSGKNDDGLHAISVGFTAHYRRMRRRYGEHMVVGCAGENIIVEHPRSLTLPDVAGGFAVLSPEGTERLRLISVDIAHPCKPFSGFAHRHEMVEP